MTTKTQKIINICRAEAAISRRRRLYAETYQDIKTGIRPPGLREFLDSEIAALDKIINEGAEHG